ncbi:MAG: hypothetical protein N2037_00105 [Acidimicrobiales bacterium]|nr:hypothetical protein [Acidimicrobiales bacterium]
MDDAIVALTEELRRALDASRLLQSMRTQEALDELKQARRELADSKNPGQLDPALATRIVNLEARHRALTQAANLVEDAADRFGEIATRLETLAAQATALSLVPDQASHHAMHQQLDDLSIAVETLRSSLNKLP